MCTAMSSKRVFRATTLASSQGELARRSVYGIEARKGHDSNATQDNGRGGRTSNARNAHTWIHEEDQEREDNSQQTMLTSSYRVVQLANGTILGGNGTTLK